MLVVLVVASGAPWESPALQVLAGDPDIVVLKRCVDVDELLATASSGQAQAALVGLDTPGLDAAAIDHLRSDGVRPVAVVERVSMDRARMRAARIGIHAVATDDALEALPDLLAVPESASSSAQPSGATLPGEQAPRDETEGAPGGRTIVIWGANGSPGRSTLATGIAAEMARRRWATILIDADPYGGTLAQQLGVLDEASGLLTAARLSAAGALDDQFPTVARSLGDHLALVSGLPRAERWVELRAGVVEHLLEIAAGRAHVVVDTGFSIEQEIGADFAARPGRNQATLDALGAADVVVVVGAADPVGLSRLARGLVEVRDHVAGVAVFVVINRMRPSLGWSEKEIASMVDGFVPLAGLHFIPDDTESVDRALVTGRSLIECGDSPVVRAISAVVDALSGAPSATGASGRGIRRRRAGTTRRR